MKTTTNPDDELVTLVIPAAPQTPGVTISDPDKKHLIPEPPEEVTRLAYALNKQVGTITEINSNYGTIELDEADIAAVKKMLRRRLFKKLMRIEKTAA